MGAGSTLGFPSHQAQKRSLSNIPAARSLLKYSNRVPLLRELVYMKLSIVPCIVIPTM